MDSRSIKVSQDPRKDLLDSIMHETEKTAQAELAILKAIKHGFSVFIPNSELEKLEILKDLKTARMHLTVKALFDMNISVKKQDTDQYGISITEFDECVTDRTTAGQQIVNSFKRIQENDGLKQAGEKLADKLSIGGKSAKTAITITEFDLIILNASKNVREKREQAALNNFLSGLKK
jgi:hypothetical protein